VSKNTLVPDKWETVPLESVCNIFDSQRIPVNVSERNKRIQGKKRDELYPYYGATGQVGWIDGYIFDGEYVLVGEDGAPFLDPLKEKAYIASGKFWVNNHAHILKAFTSNKYLKYFLDQVDFAQYVTGTTRLKLNQSNLRNIEISFPPENEQHRIVAKIEQLFSALDKGVADLKAAKKKLELYRQSLLKAAFEGRLTEQWRRDHASEIESTEELLARIKAEREKRYQQQLEEWQQAVKKWEGHGKPGKKPKKPRKPKELPPLTEEELAELPKLPEGWVWGYSEWAGDIETGTTPSKKHPEYYGSKFPFFKPTDLEAGYEVTEAREYLSSKGIKYARLLPVNSILVTSIGATIGKTGIIRCAGASNQQINAIIPIDSSNPNYVYWQTVGPLFQKELKKQASSTTMPIINKSKFALLHFAFCSKSEQDKITQLLEKAFASINHLTQTIDQALSQADLLRQAILKKAFSGQLVPQDPNDEPASELLKRIKAEREAVKAGQRGQRGRSGPGQRKGQGGQRRKARG